MKIKHGERYADGEYDNRTHEVHQDDPMDEDYAPWKKCGIFEESKSVLDVRDSLTKVECLSEVCAHCLLDERITRGSFLVAGVLMDFVVPSLKKLNEELGNL